MVPFLPPKPVTAAREKTGALQGDLRRAEAGLHEANVALAQTAAGTMATRQSVEEAHAQGVQVEADLHDAVQELQVVTDLLMVAEEEIASHDRDSGSAGHRSGNGVESVMAQMNASPKPRRSPSA
jgi:hypothetical protein